MKHTPEEIKNRLSNIGEAIGDIALDYITELEKENTELKEQVSFLKDNLRVARKDREDLQLEIGKGLQEFIKDCPYTALKFYANEKYMEENAELKSIADFQTSSNMDRYFQLKRSKEQLTQAKEIIKEQLKALDGRSEFN